MTPIRFVVTTIIAIVGLVAAASWVAASEPKSIVVTPQMESFWTEVSKAYAESAAKMQRLQQEELRRQQQDAEFTASIDKQLTEIERMLAQSDQPQAPDAAPVNPVVFVLFVAAFNGDRTLKDTAGSFSTRQRCAAAANGIVEKLKPRMFSVSWGCMTLDVSSEYLAGVQKYEADKDAGRPTEDAPPPRKDMKRAPEA